MGFEYAPAKSAANKGKHGIDFEEAQRLWDDPLLLEAHWTAVCTWRGKSIRIISVRRAREKEVEHYESD